MIMLRDTVALGQPGRNGHTPTRRAGGGRPPLPVIPGLVNPRPWRGAGCSMARFPLTAPGWSPLEVRPKRAQSPALAPITRGNRKGGTGGHRCGWVAGPGAWVRAAGAARCGAACGRSPSWGGSACAPRGSGRGAPVPVPRSVPVLWPPPWRAAGANPQPRGDPGHSPWPAACRHRPPLVFSLVMGAKAGDCARLGRTSRADHPGRRPETHHDRQPPHAGRPPRKSDP
jgi:hypothetical protein